jgi:tRNA-specific 2-thiouridylase
MSGGVDSSVAALLLLRQEYEVVGATFLQWEQAAKEAEDAAAVCRQLGVPHVVLDYRALFREQVMDYFAASYRQGETPNPCVVCNRQIKFGAFLASAEEMGCGFIATGHYAIIEHQESGRTRLRRGTHDKKDQSYVLYSLSQTQLARVLMPLGAYSKEEVRRLAEDSGLVVSKKAESQDICFIPDGDYCGFLEQYTGEKPPLGDFVGQDGAVLGQHRGLWHYTIGQRKGLGVGFGRPLYVTAIYPGDRTVALGDNELLFQRELTARDVNWIDSAPLTEPHRYDAKIRYGAKPAPALVTPLPNGEIHVLFDEPQRAITPGQSVVLYEGEYVAGGGVIL